MFVERKTFIFKFEPRESHVQIHQRSKIAGVWRKPWNKLQFVTPRIPQREIVAAFLSQGAYRTDSLRSLRNSREISVKGAMRVEQFRRFIRGCNDTNVTRRGLKRRDEMREKSVSLSRKLRAGFGSLKVAREAEAS